MAATLDLTEKLDLTQVAALRDALMDLRGQDLVLNAGKVTHMGALAVQLLRAAARDWAQAGCDLQLADLPPDTGAQLERLGYTPDTLVQAEAAL